MTDTIRFHIDPLCPWAWQGAKWITQVRTVRDIEVRWGLFSLFLINEHHDELEDDRHRMLFPLRTLAQARREQGNDGLERLYFAFGAALHETQPRPEANEAFMRDALAAAGMTDDLMDRALDDPSTERVVEGEHADVVEAVRAFGVPTIILPSGRGIFGPVKAVAPSGEAAGELWDHVRWLTEQDDFFELKRIRNRKPGLAA
jgi:protein-disulfide isomerase-like protein with CxxC motif